MPRSPQLLRNEQGSMILQVTALSALMLFMVLSGLKAVRVAIQSTNTAATSVAAKELTLMLRQSLADTGECRNRLRFTASASQTHSLITNPSASIDVAILPPGATPTTLPLASGTLPGPRTMTPDFEIESVTLSGFRRHGRDLASMAAFNGGSAASEWFLGTVSILALRRFEFLSGAELRDEFPILLQVTPTNPRAILGCTTRVVYQKGVGPPGPTQKSALECLDRGGTPVMHDNYPDYRLCRIPSSALLYCDSINDTVKDGVDPPEGWHCIKAISTPDVAYAY